MIDSRKKTRKMKQSVKPKSNTRLKAHLFSNYPPAPAQGFLTSEVFNGANKLLSIFLRSVYLLFFPS